MDGRISGGVTIIELAVPSGYVGECETPGLLEAASRLPAGQSVAQWLVESGTLSEDQVADLVSGLAGVPRRDADTRPLPAISGPRTGPLGGIGAIPGYEIIDPLGHGGMGTVYKARQLRPDRIVALKFMRTGALARRSERLRFEREAQAAADLRHPDIVTLYEFGEADGFLYMSMEYVEGLPLTAYARRHGLTLRERVVLARRICEAIAYAHGKGVIHRDLKPANILVTQAGQPKVLDFGLAKLLDARGRESLLSLTDGGQWVGTIPYMAPEQVGDGEADVRTDVYALGVVLYELLTGHLPHGEPATRPLEMARRIREEAPRRPHTISPDVRGDIETIVLKAMSADKTLRYTGADELAADLGHYMAGEPIEARRASLGCRLRKFAHRQRWRMAPVLAGMLLALAMAAWTFAVLGDVAYADLRGAAFSVSPAQLRTGDRLTVRFDTENIGRANAPGFGWAFYLSRDTHFGDEGDALLGTYVTPGLMADDRGAWTTELALPEGTDAWWSGSGTYYIGAVTDPQDAVVELDEANNSGHGLNLDYAAVRIAVRGRTHAVRHTEHEEDSAP